LFQGNVTSSVEEIPAASFEDRDEAHLGRVYDDMV
jgi:hypothetical protein